MSTNSTANIVGWVSDPNERGTIDLLWTCFATMFLCTWSAIHPNMPALGEKRSRTFLVRLVYVLICIVVPEYIACGALTEFLAAASLKAQIPDWSLRHCFFFLMGGFVVQPTSSESRSCRPRPAKLLSLLKAGAIPWPDVSEDDIEGRSRADWLIKGISMIQILYFVTSLIARWAQGLAVTTLELFTLGLVICAVLMFIAWWKKPFEVQVPIVLFSSTSIPKEDYIKNVTFLPWDASSGYGWGARTGGFVTCVAFCALHIAAWNFYFPSSTEQLLWRISSVLFTCIVVILFLTMFGILDGYSRCFDTNMYFITLLYVLVRMYMFVEMFASLRAVPESVYQTPQWSQYLPSLG